MFYPLECSLMCVVYKGVKQNALKEIIANQDGYGLLDEVK